MDQRYRNPSVSGFGQIPIAPAEPSALVEPGRDALRGPSAGQRLEQLVVGHPAYHLAPPALGGPGPGHQLFSTGCVCPDYLAPGEPPRDFGQYQPGSVPVLDVGCVTDHGQEQPGGIHYYAAFAFRHVPGWAVAASPPFSVVFTDWLSMKAQLGVGSLPSLLRTIGRSASSTRSRVPTVCHFQKYRHTVPQGAARVASPARYCHCEARTVCRLPLPQSSLFGDAPKTNPGQQAFKQAPLGIGQNCGISSPVHIPKLQTSAKSRHANPMQAPTIVTDPLLQIYQFDSDRKDRSPCKEGGIC